MRTDNKFSISSPPPPLYKLAYLKPRGKPPAPLAGTKYNSLAALYRAQNRRPCRPADTRAAHAEIAPSQRGQAAAQRGTAWDKNRQNS
ncbi:MAG: hypothetical protein LBH18_04980, partial [Spirochaetaceae bacterium]|nr:hypothetical protein [Spirochaetaceae bacterium]